MDELELLSRLLARYSPSGREGAAVAEFARLSRRLGYRSGIDRTGNGWAERGSGRPVILYLGHIDTVAGRRPVVHRSGRLHGRGAVDAKGPLAAALLAGAGFDGPGTFRVVAAVGEETDSRGARSLARGRAPDAVIAGEPSGWDGVTIGYKGDLRVELTFRSNRSHWSSPSPTATDAGLAWLGRLRATVDAAGGPSPFRSLSLKVVGCSSDPDDDPEVARFLLDLRIPPGLTCEEVLRRFPADGAPDTIRERVRLEPVEADRTSPVVTALTGAIREEGGTPTLWRRSGTSDLNLVARAWGLAGAAYGPGDSRLDHTSRESISLAEVRRAAAVLRRAVDRLARGGGR